MTFFGDTDIGLIRKSNQDRYACGVARGVVPYAVLCDGMGGHTGGNIASDITTRFVCEMFERELDGDMSPERLKEIMLAAVAGSNEVVHGQSRQDPELAKMGTTLIAVVYHAGDIHICYVGDSRVYAVSPSNEIQLTKDHTVVQMLVDIGEISGEEALSHPKRHYITKAVGVSSTVEADYIRHKLENDELILICSDGLYNYLSPGGIYPLLEHAVKTGNVGHFIRLANDAGGADNITAVVGAIPNGGNACNG